MSTSPEPVGAPSTLSVDFGEKRRKLLTSVIKHGIVRRYLSGPFISLHLNSLPQAGMATIAKENGIVSEGTGDRNKNGARDTDKA